MTPLVELLHSDRLVLRRWRVSDVGALAAAITTSLEHLRPWMPWIAAEPVSEPDRSAWIEQVTADWAAGGDVILGIFVGDAIVGGSGLHRRGGPDTLDIGYWIHVDHVRQGIAREASAMLTDAAFATAGINIVHIHHDRANAASGSIPRSLGFDLVAETPRALTAPGEVGIDCQWRVDRATWLGRRGS